MADLASTLTRVLRPALTAAVAAAINSPTVPIQATTVLPGGAVTAAVDAIAAETEAHVLASPEVRHATNAEPWYQSRVTLGALVAALVPLVGIVAGKEAGDVDQAQLVNVLVAAGTLIGAGLTLYGRWRAVRPIGV